MQIGVRGQVDLEQRALRVADGGKVIVLASAVRTSDGLMLSAAIRSGFIQTRMAKVRPPRMSAFCTPPIAVRRGWTSANEVVRHLVRLKNIGGKAQVGRGKLGVRRLNGDDRNLGFRWQIVADGSTLELMSESALFAS